MNRIRQFSPLLLVLVLTACASLYTGVVTITKAVDTTMKVYADMKVEGKTTPAIDAQVKTAHDRYREACGVAETALIAYKQSGDPAQYNLALYNAKLAAQQVLTIIKPLLVPTKADELQAQLNSAKGL